MNILKKIWLIFVMIAVGTAIDYVVHHSNPAFAVPPEYFPNKIIFGTFWGVISLYFVRYFTKNWKLQAIFVPMIVAILLQVKYFLQGYDLYFVVLFLFLHYLMFMTTAPFIFKKYNLELNS